MELDAEDEELVTQELLLGSNPDNWEAHLAVADTPVTRKDYTGEPTWSAYKTWLLNDEQQEQSSSFGQASQEQSGSRKAQDTVVIGAVREYMRACVCVCEG